MQIINYLIHLYLALIKSKSGSWENGLLGMLWRKPGCPRPGENPNGGCNIGLGVEGVIGVEDIRSGSFDL